MSTPSNVSSRGSGGGIERYRGRYLWFIAAISLAFVGLIGRLWYLQWVRGDRYYRASTQNIIRNIDLKAPRGRILDRHGRVLADNRPSFDVYVVPHIFNNHDTDQTLALLERYLHLSDEDLSRIRSRTQANAAQVLVRRDATRAQVATLESDQMRLPGVDIRPVSHRNYPLNHVGAHAIGYLAEVSGKQLDRLGRYGYEPGDYVGQMGLERAYEEVLRGSPGIDRQVVDARGIPQGEAETRFLIGDYEQVDPVPGRDLHTTLDADLMETIDRAIREYPSGAVVAMNPQNGQVLALVSKPSINPNSWTGRLSSLEKMRIDNNPFKPMLDKAVNAYFPGSIYKIVGSAAALEENLITPTTEYTCRGSYTFGGRRFRCWKYWGGHGPLSVDQALQHSCDVFFYHVADELGIDTLAKYGYRFGFGEKTGIPINFESAGRVPTKEWHRKHSPNGYQYGFALNTVIGQGDTLVTPLQAAVAYSAIANGGKLFYPKLVDTVASASGNRLFEYPSTVRRRLGFDQETIDTIQQGLFKVVNEDGGTAYTRRLDDIEVSGKTGTAQVHSIGAVRIANRNKKFQLRDHAWFAAYAPSDDPKIAVVVFLEHAGHGGAEGGPVAMKVIKHYLEHAGAQPDRPSAQTPANQPASQDAQ